MAASLQMDTMGMDVTHSRDSVKITRYAKITGLVSVAVLDKVGEAYAALNSEGSTIGSTWTISALGIYVRLVDRKLKAVSTDAFEITLNYSTDDVPKGGDPTAPTLPVYKGSARLVQGTTGFDRSGTQITVSKAGSPDQHPTVNAMLPQATVSVSRVESGIRPLDVAGAILGKLNETTWNGPVGAWLCTGINFESEDGGLEWKMDYEFQRGDELGWQPQAAYTEPDGTLATGITEANGGRQVVDWYTSYDYTKLGI